MKGERAKLSAFVISYNRQSLIGTTLRALAFVDELVLVDKSSTDDTAKIAGPLVDRLVTAPWSPTAEDNRAEAASLCSHEWILYLDDDECLTPEAVLFIDQELRSPRADVYALPQRHHILGVHDEAAYYWPEHQVRLFRRGALEFTRTVHRGFRLNSDRVFEIPADDGVSIMHLSHGDVAQWIEKTNRYTSQPDRVRALDESGDLVSFARRSIETWTAGRGDGSGADYPAAVGLLRATYDMVDRLKTWEEERGFAGYDNFAAICRTLDSRYEAELAHIARRRKGAAACHLPPAAAVEAPADGLATLVRANATLADILHATRAAGEDLRRQLDLTRSELAERDAYLAQIESRATQQADELAKRAEQTQALAAQLSDAEAKLREKSAQTRELEASMAEKSARIRDLETSVARNATKFDELERLLKQESDAARSEIYVLSQQLVHARQEVATLADDIFQLRPSVLRRPFREAMRLERRIRNALKPRAAKREPEPATSPSSIEPTQEPHAPKAGGERDIEAHKVALRSALSLRLKGFIASGASLRLPRSNAPDVSIILVLYNQVELTFACLCSIAECMSNSKISAEIIILDNGSTDGTSELLNRVEGARTIRSPVNLHFLRGVNEAAGVAKGRHLLLLNNDAQLYPGAIEAAVGILDSDAGVAAVGGRIILPNGTLQEAGSIIWNDGSCAGYARGHEPDAPDVMFRRDVDFCSGAFLMTPRLVFQELGGFDEAYAPAYYEETDYCVRLWKAGYRVVYEPDATILHYEFGSAAHSGEAIELQRRNQLKFRERHAEWLAGQYANEPGQMLPARERRSGRPRVLMIEDRVPHESLGSGFPRAKAMLSELAKQCDVVFFPTAGNPESWPETRQTVPPNVEVALGHSVATLRDFLRERRGQFDAILVCRPHNMAAFVRAGGDDPAARGYAEVIYDAEAVFALREAQRLSLEGSPLSDQQERKALEQELSLAACASTIIAVSAAEKRLFDAGRFRSVRVLGHPFDVQPSTRSFEERQTILFVGGVHEEQSPNADSLRWFGKEILPRIRDVLGPSTRLRVVGVSSVPSICRMAGHELDLVGPVQDLGPEFDNARLLVAPTRFAAGIPLKIGQAAAYGVPVVATNLLADQLGWQSGRDLLAASEPKAFADACIKLYTDGDLWRRLREQAMTRCAEDWSPDSFRRAIDEIVQEIKDARKRAEYL